RGLDLHDRRVRVAARVVVPEFEGVVVGRGRGHRPQAYAAPPAVVEGAMAYDLAPARVPRLTGFALDALAAALESPVTGGLLLPKLLRDGGFETLRHAVLVEAPSVLPALPRLGVAPPAPKPVDRFALAASAPQPSGFAFETVADFVRAYREKKT